MRSVNSFRNFELPWGLQARTEFGGAYSEIFPLIQALYHIFAHCTTHSPIVPFIFSLYHSFSHCTTHSAIVPPIRPLYHPLGHWTTHPPLYHPSAIVPL
ncbi:hypothetical protein B9Z55_024902 [Caenorhabditis nigoni]|uniref:Uncharacterized protein n=1 Tax=Caenorhabditis nigoni TaxID=1611254 RepID=A0A2G5SW73_9PELO|nr:hypothetical protein B9Z55_024902 [Caenorhabditis nigoni]